MQLEIAWLGYRLGQDNLDQAIEEQLAGQLTMRQAAQLRSDWKRYVLDAA